jgi:dolichol-phosphate mannosyltransferase
MKLTVVSPTYNEADNIQPLIETLAGMLAHIDHEIIIVDDDSPDKTWAVAERMRAQYPTLKVLRRTKERGLSSAVIDGFLAAQGEIVACIDGDLQHDPAQLPQLLDALEAGADVAIGSRYMEGGEVGEWNRVRRWASWLATKLAHLFLGVKITDPMSGFFMLRKEAFLEVVGSLNTRGFKILLEILAHMKPQTIREIPIIFRPRAAGISKLSSKIVYYYLHQLWRLSPLGKILPARFLKFGLVGASGVVINLLAMALIIRLLAWHNWRASFIASFFAMINNYVLNNLWTFRDRARTGVDAFSGFFTFAMISLIGLLITTGMYTVFTQIVKKLTGTIDSNSVLPLGVLLACQLVAIMCGMYFNYKLNKVFTWKERGYRDEDDPEV